MACSRDFEWAARIFWIALFVIVGAVVFYGAQIGGAWAQTVTYDTTITEGKQTGLSVEQVGDSYRFTFAADNALAYSLSCNNTAQIYHSAVFTRGDWTYRQPSFAVHDNSVRPFFPTTGDVQSFFYFPFSAFDQVFSRVQGFATPNSASSIQLQLGSEPRSSAVSPGQLIRFDAQSPYPSLPLYVRDTYRGFWLGTAYPEYIQDLGAFELLKNIRANENAASTISDELKRGDMLMMMHTATNNVDTDLRQFATTGLVRGVHMSLYIVDDSDDRLIWSGGGNIKGMLLRPLYDIDGSIPARTATQMIIPSYLFSNVQGRVQCSGFVSPFPVGDNTNLYRTEFVTFDVSYDCDTTPLMPVTRWTTSDRIGFAEVRPDTYCKRGAVEPRTNVMTESDARPAARNETITVEIPGVMEMQRYTYEDLWELNRANDLNTGKAHVELVGKAVPGAATGTYYYAQWDATDREPYRPCTARGTMSGAEEYLMPARTLTNNLENFARVLKTPQAFTLSEPVEVQCGHLSTWQGFGIGSYVSAASDVDDLRFAHAFEAHSPVYAQMLAALNNNEFGWGTGTTEDGFTLGIMGMPFVAVMGIISAFVAFQRNHLPAAIIVYVTVLGAMQVLGMLQWETTVFGGIIFVAAIGLFSKGMR